MNSISSYYQNRYGSSNAQNTAKKYYGSGQKSNTLASRQARQKYDAQTRAKSNYYNTATKELAGAGGYDSQYGGGLSSADLYSLLGNGPTVGGPSSGGGSGGGGGYGGGGSAAAQTAAYQGALAAMAGQTNPYNDTSRFDALFDPSVINNRFDAYGQQVGSAASTGRDRIAGIAGELSGRIGQAGTAIQGGFDARQQALQALQQEFLQAQGVEQAGLNKILSAADAGSVQAQAAPLNNLFTASRAAVGDQANLFAQSMADRQAISGQLQQDVGLGMSQQEQALMAQIAAQRAGQLQSNGDSKNKLLAELAIKAQEWENQRLQQEQALRLQAAQMGISI